MVQQTNRHRSDRESDAPSRMEVPEASDLSGQLQGVFSNAIEILDAQISIVTLKGTRAIVIAAFGIVGVVSLAAMAYHGCTLLDGSFNYALSQPPLPVWFSPLLRGSIYVGVPAAGLAWIWNVMVGFGSSEVNPGDCHGKLS